MLACFNISVFGARGARSSLSTSAIVQREIRHLSPVPSILRELRCAITAVADRPVCSPNVWPGRISRRKAKFIRPKVIPF